MVQGGIGVNAFYEHRDETLFIGEMTHFPFPVHVHEVAEILCVTSGSVRLSIDGNPCLLSPGDVAVIFPLTLHSYDEIIGDASGLVAIFPPDIIPEYNSTFHTLTPENPIIRSGTAGAELSNVVTRLHALDMAESLPLCVAYLHVLLACTLHALSYHPVFDFSDRSLGHRIMRYMDEHAYDEITLASVSHALGISVSHLSHFFGEKLHINFRQYINAKRIDRARLMMRESGNTLTMISYACGYTNMRTFRRAFFKEMGCLPSDYVEVLRNRIRGGDPVPGLRE